MTLSLPRYYLNDLKIHMMVVMLTQVCALLLEGLSKLNEISFARRHGGFDRHMYVSSYLVVSY